MPYPAKFIIDIKNLCVMYDQKIVLQNVHATFPPQTLCSIVGPNGSGKTTLLKTIMGIIKPQTGSITIHTQPNHQPSIAYVTQKSCVDWNFPICVYDVVLMGRCAKQAWWQRPNKHDHEIARWALEQVKMSAMADWHISKLSGGQQQRIFLARALAQEADILLLDEPFAAVDMHTQQFILHLLQELCVQGKNVIVVHHDIFTVQKYFEWTLLLNSSNIAQGLTRTVITPENLAATFQTNTRFYDAI
jgi:manganese/zinc/iron transport system ATP- binding protein